MRCWNMGTSLWKYSLSDSPGLSTHEVSWEEEQREKILEGKWRDPVIHWVVMGNLRRLNFLGSTFLFCQENTTMYLRGLTGLHFSMPAFITFGRTTLCPGRRWVCPLPLTPALISTVGFTPPGISDPQSGIANYHVTCSAMHTNGDTVGASSILN